MKLPLYQIISRTISLLDAANVDHIGAAENRLDYIEKEILPSGSGFDAGTKIDREASTPNKLVLTTSFHHMNDAGYYDGWTEHKVIVKPDLQWGFSLAVTGRDKRDIKEYIGDMFHNLIGREIDVNELPR